MLMQSEFNGIMLRTKLVARSTGMMIGVRDRATCLKAEDIAEACEDNNNKGNAFLRSSTHIEDEVFMVPSKQNPPTVPSISHTKKQKLLPLTISSRNKKKSLTRQTTNAKLDGFCPDFESVCGPMASKMALLLMH
ncbi:hypothetical protein Tco_1048299 [Tanacetum coccineum]